ncbi:hypothetical protein ACAN107058_19075 [Paracidovorax anthurii]
MGRGRQCGNAGAAHPGLHGLRGRPARHPFRLRRCAAEGLEFRRPVPARQCGHGRRRRAARHGRRRPVAGPGRQRHHRRLRGQRRARRRRGRRHLARGRRQRRADRGRRQPHGQRHAVRQRGRRHPLCLRDRLLAALGRRGRGHLPHRPLGRSAHHRARRCRGAGRAGVRCRDRAGPGVGGARGRLGCSQREGCGHRSTQDDGRAVGAVLQRAAGGRGAGALRGRSGHGLDAAGPTAKSPRRGLGARQTRGLRFLGRPPGGRSGR